MTPAETVLLLKMREGISSAYAAGYLMVNQKQALAWIKAHGAVRRRVGAMKLWTTAAPKTAAQDEWNARAK